MEQDRSRSIWEILSDVFREISILLLVFGVLLDHDHMGYKHGIVVAIGSMLSLGVSLIFEVWRERTKKVNKW